MFICYYTSELKVFNFWVEKNLINVGTEFLVHVVNLLIVVASAPDLTVGPAPVLNADLTRAR